VRIVIIADKPSHYRVDLYNAMTALYGNEILFFFSPEPRYSERSVISVYTGEPFLLNSSFFNHQSGLKRTLKLLFALRKNKPDVMINIGMSWRLPLLILYSKLSGIKIWIWWGGTKDSEKAMPRLKHLYRKIMLGFIDGVFCYSSFAQEYVQALAGNINTLILGNNTFDTHNYREKITILRTALSSKPDESIRILATGFLTDQKNLITILRVYAELKKQYYEISLFIVGDGPESFELHSFVNNNNISGVTFTGFIEPEDMPEQYAAADIYVHPASLDRWPQTFNEASAAGLPILVSNTSGVSNAYTKVYAEKIFFDPYDEKRLYMLLETFIRKPELRKELGAVAQQAALGNDCKVVVKRIDTALKQ
jgi:glycosyltransferase involved in cell wall biosynthesis